MKQIQRFLICILLLSFILVFFAHAESPVELIQSGAPLIGKAEYVGPIPHVDENFRILQGGCVYENYGWFAMIGADKAQHYPLTETYILKFDVNTMEEIARSQILKLGHANDITYIPETNELWVVHVTGRQISILDADTLEYKDKKRMTTEAYGLDYEKKTGRYVIGFSTLGMLMYEDDALKNASAYSFPIETNLVTQGMCCDEHYIYHVLYSTKDNIAEPDNVIIVFDWEGKEITRIPIGLKGMEPENITLVDHVFYVGFNQTEVPDAELLYKIHIEKAE